VVGNVVCTMLALANVSSNSAGGSLWRMVDNAVHGWAERSGEGGGRAYLGR
jgi:hypothetical protein